MRALNPVCASRGCRGPASDSRQSSPAGCKIDDFDYRRVDACVSTLASRSSSGEAMADLLTPEYCRAAAQDARERAAAVAPDRSLSIAYKQLALDFEALATSLEVLRAKDAASDSPE